MSAAPAGKYLVDAYEDWCRGEGVPIVTGAAIDLLGVRTAPWARLGASAAFCHLDGRCDYLALTVVDLDGETRPRRHLHEALCFVLEGTGATEVERTNGRRDTIAWGPSSLFAVPMNAPHRHRGHARFAVFSDLRYLMNLYRNERFLFDMPLAFPEREGVSEHVADLTTAPPGPIALAQGSIGADLVTLAPGEALAPHRQMQGSHILGLAGEGATESWREGEAPQRTTWRRGVAYGPGGLHWHRHLNPGATPARFLEVQLGTPDNPILRSRRAGYDKVSNTQIDADKRG